MTARSAGALALALVAAGCCRGAECKEPSVSRLEVWDVEVSKDGCSLFADFAQPGWVEPSDRYPLDLRDVFSFTIAALESADVTVASFVVDGFTPTCE